MVSNLLAFFPAWTLCIMNIQTDIDKICGTLINARIEKFVSATSDRDYIKQIPMYKTKER